jgi:hypothetical protein
LVLGLVLVAAGVLWLLETTDAVAVPWAALAPVALIVVGIGLVAASRTGAGTGGLLTVGIILAVVSTLFAAVDLRLAGGVGQRREQPRTATDLRDSYELAAGQLVLDLSDLGLPPGSTRIRASVALGELQVIVPEGVALLAEGEVSAGEVQLVERSAEGLGARTTFRSPGFSDQDRRLELHLSVGLGKIELRR